MRKFYSIISISFLIGIGHIHAQNIWMKSNSDAVAPSHRTLEVTARVSNSTICYGDSATLSCTPTGGLPPYTYNWSPIVGLKCPTCQNTKTSPPTSTVYTITVTDRLANTASATVSLTVDPALNLTLSSSSTHPCKGNIVYLTASPTGGTTPYTYSWTPAALLNAANIYNPYYTAITNKTFTCKVTDALGCTITASIIENIDDLDVTVTNQKICPNTTTSSTATVSGANALPPYTYSWMPGGQTNQTATGLSAGTYTVSVSDANGCSSSAITHITLFPAPVFNAAANLASVIEGDSLSATGGTPPYTYTFAPPILSGGILTLPTVTTTFTLTVTDSNGCTTSDTAKFIPTPDSAGPCGAIFISEYIQDSANHDDGIELYNPTGRAINLSTYYLGGTTNGSLFAPPFIIKLHGTIGAHKTFLIANGLADTALTNKAKMLTDSLNFGGKDIVALGRIVATRTYVNFTLIDMVGSISILPATNGWPVGSGSTKNHTLLRKPMVVEGDPNWLTCQHEWTAYPQGTFSYLGSFKSGCPITDPDITFSIAPLPPTCGNPSYANFAIMAKSNPPTIFNSAIIGIMYSYQEFKGDGSPFQDINVVAGPNFQYVNGNNDYNLFNMSGRGDSVIGVYFGDALDSSPHGTVLDTNFQELLIVSFQIKNCKTGPIELTYPGIVALPTYESIDSVYSGHRKDSTFLRDSLYNPHGCDPYPCDPYPCHGYCCSYDGNGDCIDSCFDTCYMTCYSNTCYDTLAIYSYDTVSVYTVLSRQVLSYTNTYLEPDTITSSSCGIYLDPISKAINAGTNNSSVPANSSILTLTGYGFGQQLGQIELPDANSGGANKLLLDSKDIKSWSDNEIVVKMPSVIFDPTYRSYSPGTGNILISSTCNDSASTPLRIDYSIINEQNGAGTKYRGNIVMVDNSSSLIFRCDTSVSHNPQAYACLKKAVREWNCYTGVNWIVAKDTAMAKDTLDGISNVYFSNSLIDSSTVMSTTSHPFPCPDVDSMVYTDDADINIRIKLPHGLTWNYDTTGMTGGNVCYFYDFISHELGHGHLLGHIIDSISLMYYAFSSSQRYNLTTGLWPGPQTLYGGFDVVNTSAAITNTCSFIQLIPSTRTCVDPSLGMSAISSDNNNINVYPNPSINGEITIFYNLAENSYIQLIIYDCIGREMTTLANGHKAAGSYNEHINIAGWAQGVYMLVANINGVHQTIKFIKN